MTEDPYWNAYNMLYGNATNSVVRNVYYPAVVQSGNRFGYGMNNPANYVDPNGTDAIILTSDEAAAYAGHTSALYQDLDGVWYYTYWGMDAAAVIRIDTFYVHLDDKENLISQGESMSSIEDFNHALSSILKENGWDNINIKL